MQVLIDHIAAVVVGAAVIFLLAAMMLRMQEGSMEAAQVDAARGGLRLLIDMVEQDINNAGSGMRNPNSTLADAAFTFFGQAGGYTELRFRGLPAMGVATPAVITYRWRQDGTATLSNGTVVPTLRVERLVDGAASGSSFNNITAFEVQLLDDNLNVFDPTSGQYNLVRYVNVAISMVSPLGAEGVIEQTRWVKQFRPVNLNPDTRTVLRVA